MYKVVWVARFHDGISPEAARKHWREVHAPLGMKVEGVERYVQNHVVSALGPSMIVRESSAALEPSQRLSSKRFGLSTPSAAHSGVRSDSSKASRSRYQQHE